MKRNIKSFSCGFLVCLMLFSSVGVFADTVIKGVTKTVKAVFNSYLVKIDGKSLAGDNIVYNGKNYVDLQQVATLLGKDYKWDAKTKTLNLTEKGKSVVQNNITVPTKKVDVVYGDLTDAQIKQALEVGSKMSFDELNVFSSKYTVPCIQKKSLMLNTEVKIGTTYNFLVQSSAMKALKYEILTFLDAKKYVEANIQDKELNIIISLEGNSIDFHKDLSFVMIQGEKQIKVKDITQSSLADTAHNWPNFPAYQTTVVLTFDMNEIDFTKQAELKIKQLLTYEDIYAIDFSKYN